MSKPVMEPDDDAVRELSPNKEYIQSAFNTYCSVCLISASLYLEQSKGDRSMIIWIPWLRCNCYYE